MDNYFIRRTFLVIIKDKDGVTRVIKTKDFNKNELNLNLVKNEEELIQNWENIIYENKRVYK